MGLVVGRTGPGPSCCETMVCAVAVGDLVGRVWPTCDWLWSLVVYNCCGCTGQESRPPADCEVPLCMTSVGMLVGRKAPRIAGCKAQWHAIATTVRMSGTCPCVVDLWCPVACNYCRYVGGEDRHPVMLLWDLVVCDCYGCTVGQDRASSTASCVVAQWHRTSTRVGGATPPQIG